MVGKSCWLFAPHPTASPAETARPLEADTIHVHLTGQFTATGEFEFPRGTKEGDVLAQVPPLPNGDLSGIRPRRLVRDGDTLVIPEKKWIQVAVRGAVQRETTLRLLSGARYCELLGQIDLSPEADQSAVKRKKRFLCDGETITIPSKKKVSRKKNVKITKKGENSSCEKE